MTKCSCDSYQVFKRTRPLFLTLLIPWMVSCSSMDTEKINKKDKQVQYHELFGGDVRSVSVMKEQMQDIRSGTRFDKIDKKDLTEQEQAQLRKFQHIEKGDMALHSGNVDVALYQYVRALVEDNLDIQVFYKIGVLHESRHNVALAKLAYLRALDIEPKFVLALERVGRLKLNAREYADARVYFEKAIEADRVRIDSMTSHADTVDSSGTVSNDIDYYSPYYAYTGMGVIEDLNKQHQQAIWYYQKAMSLRPRSAPAESNLGYSYYLNEDLDQAERHFRRSISKDKSYSKAWRNLALIYVKNGKYSEAVNLLVDHTKDKPSAYNTVGYICMLNNKYNQAEKYFNRAIDLSPVYFEIAVQNRDTNRRRYSQTIYEPLN